MSEVSSVSLECRDMRHAWFAEGDNVIIEEKKRIRHFRRRATCIRCETTKTEEFKVSYRGDRVVAVGLVRRKYDYVQGYQVQGGLKVADARAMRFAGLEFTYEQG